MMMKGILLAIGVAIFGTGIYYRVKESQDEASRKIYTAASVVGGILAAGSALLMFL